MDFISKRLDLFDSTSFSKALSLRMQMTDAIDLSIGIPEEPTSQHTKAGGIQAIIENKTEYTPSNGLYELRAGLAEKLSTENNINCNPDQVTIVPGLTTGQMIVYLTLLDPGDEIIIFEPYYPPYPHLATMLGAVPVYVSTFPNFQPNLDELRLKITPRTKAILVNSPNNPSGAIYPESVLRDIAHIATENNLLVISDEIYEHFTYTKKHFSIGSIYSNTITMNGFSKEFAMTGWRIGYISGPQNIIDAINAMQQYVVMSSSSIGQHAAYAALQHRTSLVEKYRIKRNIVDESLKRVGYKESHLDGAFYAFIPTPGAMNDVAFVNLAAKHGLILLPGSAFSSRTDYVRISYGTTKYDVVKGMNIFCDLVSELKK